MIAKRTGHVALLLLLAGAGAAWAEPTAEPPVAVNTEGLALNVAAHVQRKAAEGITALRQYVWISRGVNQLDLRSLIREQPGQEDVAAAQPDTRPATVAALDEQR